jgi:hypothetical protein
MKIIEPTKSRRWESKSSRPMTMLMRWDYVSELRPHLAYCSCPGWYMSTESHDRWRRLAKLRIRPPERCQSYHKSHLVTNPKNVDKENDGFCLQNISFILYGSLTCRKIIRHGTSGFTSLPKEGALRNFIALKISSPRPGLNSRTLCPTVSTLTITPPRLQADPCNKRVFLDSNYGYFSKNKCFIYAVNSQY